MPRILPSALLAACLIALVANPTPVSALSDVVPKYHHNRRMIKVREPKPVFPFGNNPAPTTTTTTAAAAVTTTTTPAAVTTTTAAQTTAAATTTADQQGSPDQGLTVTTPGSSTTLSTTSSAATTTAAAVTTTAAALPTTLSPVVTANPFSTIAIQSTIEALPTSTAEAATASNSFGRNSIIAIVVIASCVGGAAAIWTLIRKWKLGTSAKFDNRLQPIEWSPDVNGTKGDDVNPAEKRRGSTGSHGSFHSGEGANLGRNVTGNANMFAGQDPAIEAHDFTAGPADAYGQHNAYGNYDYGYGAAAAGAGAAGGLQRQKSSGAELTREPSAGGHSLHGGSGGYDHYAGAYGQDAYAQDAYGGYDNYAQQPQHAQDAYAHQQDPYNHAQYPARY